MELNREHLEAVEALAKVNMEISSGKAILMQMKGDVKNFLSERERLEKDAIAKIYAESSDLIASISKNHAKVKAYYNDIRSQTVFLNEMQESLAVMIKDFADSVTNFTEYTKQETNRLSGLKKDLETEEKMIEQEKKGLERERAEIHKDRKHLESQQKTLEISYQEFKKLWTK